MVQTRWGDLKLPSLSREAEIAVYIVHNTRDPEDYFFLFDFEEFVARSEGNLFVRPALRLFAGRDDFSRSRFAREFREVFAAEFDRMRAAMAARKGKRGWLSWEFVGASVLEMTGGVLATLLLSMALFAGKRVLGLEMPGWLRGKSSEAKLADQIDDLRGRVEEALTRVDVTLHPELYDHAWRGGGLGPISGVDRNAWPLPAYVRAHLDAGEASAFW